MAEVLPKANAAGMRLVLGDDYGAIFFPHGPYAEELAYYVEEIGIPALDVIRWATKHGAELMGRGDELGTVDGGQARRPAGGRRRPARRRHRPPGPDQPARHHQGRPDGQGRPGGDGPTERRPVLTVAPRPHRSLPTRPVPTLRHRRTTAQAPDSGFRGRVGVDRGASP